MKDDIMTEAKKFAKARINYTKKERDSMHRQSRREERDMIKKTQNESIDSKKPYVDFINSICSNDYAAAKVSMQALVDMKLREKIAKSSSKS